MFKCVDDSRLGLFTDSATVQLVLWVNLFLEVTLSNLPNSSIRDHVLQEGHDINEVISKLSISQNSTLSIFWKAYL